MDAVVLAAAGFAGAGVLAAAAPRALRAWHPLIPLVAVASAAAAVAAAPAATGIAALDAALRAGLGAGAVALGAAARRRTTLAVAGAGALALACTAGGSGAGQAPAALALGAALAALASRLDSPLLNAAGAGLVAQAALRLERPATTGATAAVAAVALGAVAATGWRALAPARRRAVTQAGLATAGLAVAAGLLGLLAAALARPAVEDGIRAATAGLEAATATDGTRAAAHLRRAEEAFTRAERHLGAWWARPALAVPLVAQHARALTTMASAGARLSAAGARTAEAADPRALQVSAAAVPLDRIAALRGPVHEAFSALAGAGADLAGVASPWLVGPVADRLATLTERVGEARQDVRAAMAAVDVAPAMLGAGGPRRYFLAIQTPSELRGSGGFIGNFGELMANAGRVSLDKVGRTADLNAGGDPARRKLEAPADYLGRYARFDVNLLWQNVTMSPDFPTVARAVTSLYPQSGGRPIDGVVAIDPAGLAALLRVVGPVEVPGWPGPIDADNAAPILLHEQYVRLSGDARVDFLGQVTAAVWQRLATTTAPLRDLGRALGPMLAEKHLMLASTRPGEQRALLELGAAGAMAPVRGDFIGVVTQNAGANKIDWFLRRALDYEARFDPATGQVRATARVTLRNEAPAAGLPAYIIGNQATPPIPSGANKSYLSVYSPLLLAGARLDGQPLLMESELERGRHVYSTYVTVPPGGEAVIELDLTGRVGAPEGSYRLGVHRQPFLAPDTVTTTLTVARGWSVRTGGGGRTWRRELVLTTDETLSVPLRQPR